MSHVFGRNMFATVPVAVRGEGVWITDADGNRYLDGSGGAIVVGIGHGDAEVAAAMAEQAGRLAYAHPTAFTTEAVEAYAESWWQGLLRFAKRNEVLLWLLAAYAGVKFLLFFLRSVER